MRRLLLAALVSWTVGSQAYGGELGEVDRDTYPKAISQRPLYLPPGMFELRLGGASDFAGNNQDRFNSKLDWIYGVASRFQVGVESELGAFPINEFQVGEVAVWADYNVVPNASFRLGGYMTAPRVADELDFGLGVLAAIPLRFSLTGAGAIVALPRLNFEEGGNHLELPLGIQYQLGDTVALLAGVGLETRNFEFNEGTWALPASVGMAIAFSRLLDFTAEYRFLDLAHGGAAGRDDRWVYAFFSVRN
jgi:hypothetical protein